MIDIVQSKYPDTDALHIVVRTHNEEKKEWKDIQTNNSTGTLHTLSFFPSYHHYSLFFLPFPNRPANSSYHRFFLTPSILRCPTFLNKLATIFILFPLLSSFLMQRLVIIFLLSSLFYSRIRQYLCSFILCCST